MLAIIGYVACMLLLTFSEKWGYLRILVVVISPSPASLWLRKLRTVKITSTTRAITEWLQISLKQTKWARVSSVLLHAGRWKTIKQACYYLVGGIHYIVNIWHRACAWFYDIVFISAFTSGYNVTMLQYTYIHVCTFTLTGALYYRKLHTYTASMLIWLTACYCVMTTVCMHRCSMVQMKPWSGSAYMQQCNWWGISIGCILTLRTVIFIIAINR